MNLISTLSSGESLEKAIVLAYLGIKNNPSFYEKYEKIFIYYDENLPKKNIDLPAHGTMNAIINNFPNRTYVPYSNLNDLWDDRLRIINCLTDVNRISNRVGSKLLIDRKRFIDIIKNVPWYFFLPRLKDNLLKQLGGIIPKARFYQLNLREDFSELTWNIPSYSPIAKIYLLNQDGNISSCPIGRIRQNEERKINKRITNSIVCSGNVYLYLIKLNLEVSKNKEDFDLGYRPMLRYPRKSYDAALTEILSKKRNIILEPQNIAFSQILQSFDFNFPHEFKINAAIYKVLNEFYH